MSGIVRRLSDTLPDPLGKEFEVLSAEAADRLKYAMEFAHAALRGLTLANGGAIIALFTFIGNEGRVFNGPWLWWAFGSFAVGLAATLATVILAYLSQGFNYQCVRAQMITEQNKMMGSEEVCDGEPDRRRGSRLEFAAIATAALGLVAFIAGSGFALQAGLIS